MKTGHEEGMQIGEHRLVMFSQMFHFSCSRWCAALCDISNVLDRVHPSIRPILAAHEQASMSLEDIEALKKATSEFIGGFEAACKELRPLVRDLAEAEQKVKMTYSGFMRGCEAVESERRALYLRGLVELLKARAACLEPVEGAALPWGAEGCFAATAPTATENTSREPTPGAVKGKGVWHISPEEREKYKGALAEKPKREEVEQFIEDFAEEVAVIKQAVEHAGESDSPSSASVKDEGKLKRRLGRSALVAHTALALFIFMLCIPDGENRPDYWVPMAIFFIWGGISVIRSRRMLRTGWRLSYRAYSKKLSVAIPVSLFLSLLLFVIAAATDAGMFRLGFLLIYWIPGGIFLVHFINSLEKKR